jgi:ABC-type transporter Mla MlaB component
MALFSKPPVKKPEPLKPEARPATAPPATRAPSRPGERPLSAREVAFEAQGRRGGTERPQFEPHGDITVTGASLIEWSPANAAIEVAQANPGLCAVLENAALLYASGQKGPARDLLDQGVQDDHDTRQSPLAWLALFDLLQRSNDRAAFDQLALQYVVAFERSAPAWEEGLKTTEGPKAVAGGYIPVTGKLCQTSTTQLDLVARAIDKKVPHARLDLASVNGFDDAGARLLADTLALARRKHFALSLQRPEKLKVALDAMVRKGKDAGEGAWLLSLEMLQFEHQQQLFDDRAIEYAVAFEQSPPSWEPPPLPSDAAADAAAAVSAAGDGTEGAAHDVQERLAWSGVMTGSSNAHLAKLPEFASRRAVVPIEMSDVERIDFVCAGALLNAINRIESQRKAVQIIGASPIIRALLLLIGISPRHFLKRAQ